MNTPKRLLQMSVCFFFALFLETAITKADTLLVDDDKVECPKAAFTSIQSAVNAADAGDVIHVCAGKYPEQVLITKPISIEADNGAILIPSGVIANTTGFSAEPIAAILLAKNAAGVNVEGLIVDGSGNGLTACAPRLIGILYQNASGTIKNNAVRHVKLAPSLLGCQSGDGIVVQSLSGGDSKVTVRDNSVNDYQKNGITGNETGTDVSVQGNVVTGVGPTPGAAQNGVQVGFGAEGDVGYNTVTDNVWSTCISISQCTANGTGILIFQSDGVRVQHNVVGTNQVGIYVGGSDSIVRDNEVFNSIIFVGIDLAGGKSTTSGNHVTHSDQAGIFIESSDNKVHNNAIEDAAVGILKLTTAFGNTLTGNHFFATVIPVQDPPGVREIRVEAAR